MKTVTTSSF